jgi:acyl CoA:acetate/3-ketoacid CoA transferase beta subunit
MMEHTTRDGSPRLLRECKLPVTARGVVKLLMTDLGLFEPTGNGFRMLEVAPGFTLEDVQAATEAPVEAASDMREVQIG